MISSMIGITLGDPAGIGPEIVVKALASQKDLGRFVVYGERCALEDALSLCRLKMGICSPEEDREGCIMLHDTATLERGGYRMGCESAQCGRASYLAVEAAVEDALSGALSSVCTAPINKRSLHLAKVPYIGHTEIFAQLTGASHPLTMFAVDNLRIFFLSRHVSLSQAIALVTYDRLIDYIPRCIRELEKLGVEGTLAVAGLNPHCGDGGLFGSEDRVVGEAVASCRSRGLDVVGPVGADSIFAQCLKGRYAAVLSLYHDQGHIAAKTYDFERTVSLTLGMPVLRISVDHGTAFDIAGKGVADSRGMEEVLRLALDVEARRKGSSR